MLDIHQRMRRLEAHAEALRHDLNIHRAEKTQEKSEESASAQLLLVETEIALTLEEIKRRDGLLRYLNDTDERGEEIATRP